MNKNYIRGRNAEYAYCQHLKSQGWKWVQRTAGSHSPFDVIAVNECEVLLVQLKRTKNKNFSYKKELKEFKKLKVPIFCTTRFVVYLDKKGFIPLYEN